MSISWVAAHLPWLAPHAYCHMSRETLQAVEWHAYNSVGVCVCIRACTSFWDSLGVTLSSVCVALPLSEAQISKPDPGFATNLLSSLSMQLFLSELVFKWKQMHCGFSVSVYTCIYPRTCEHADVQHGCQAAEQPNQSSATCSVQVTCRQSKQTWRRRGRHHYAAQHAVCPDPVWGPLVSADSNELPWVPFYRHPASWGWRGVEGDIYTPTQTSARKHETRITSAAATHRFFWAGIRKIPTVGTSGPQSCRRFACGTSCKAPHAQPVSPLGWLGFTKQDHTADVTRRQSAKVVNLKVHSLPILH